MCLVCYNTAQYSISNLRINIQDALVEKFGGHRILAVPNKKIINDLLDFFDWVEIDGSCP